MTSFSVSSFPAGRLDPEEDAEARDALADLGFRNDTVHVEFNRSSSTIEVEIDVPIGNVRRDGPRIEHALRGVLPNVGQVGVRYRLAVCEPVVADVRRALIDQGRSRAAALGAAMRGRALDGSVTVPAEPPSGSTLAAAFQGDALACGLDRTSGPNASLPLTLRRT